MTRWEVFRFLCRCLGAAFSAGHPRIPSAAVPWTLVVEAADDHVVGPTLGWCIRGNERVPTDVRVCFETLLDLNRRRNEIMLEALDGALGSLNAEGITPLLLKGAAALVQDLYPDPGMRIVGDLDLLVRGADTQKAAAALERAGFGVAIARPSLEPDPHHLPLRVHAELKVGIELHKRPVPRAFDALLDARQCFSDARPRLWRARQVLMPGPADWLVHNIAHGQLAHRHYWRGVPHLRQLFELALLRGRVVNPTDMQRAEERFRSAGYGRVFDNTVLLGEFLLGPREMVEGPSDAPDAIARVRRAVDRPGAYRWTMYRRFLVRNVRRAMMNPRVVVQTLRPSFWAQELKGVRRRLRVPRW